jgi:hypothetical protein
MTALDDPLKEVLEEYQHRDILPGELVNNELLYLVTRFHTLDNKDIDVDGNALLEVVHAVCLSSGVQP